MILYLIDKKVSNKERITLEEALFLYEKAPLDWLKTWSFFSCSKLHQNKVYYNKNIHFEPTNKCIYTCKFCSFYRQPSATQEEGAWNYNLNDLEKKLLKYPQGSISEIHITGGIHPHRGLDWAIKLFNCIRKSHKDIHIKAFTAVEIYWLCRFSKVSLQEGLTILKVAGLNSLPGGGAEIFDPKIRKAIAGSKVPVDCWLEVHQLAHEMDLESNATMLYGHIEDYSHRIAHMDKIRQLQDKTKGFNCFIPLKYRKANNELKSEEVSTEEDLRCFAIARLFLDNIKHLKAYWVMLGLETAFEVLEYGANDFDGTIDDSTKIYSMAGAMQSPNLSSQFIKEQARLRRKKAIERDSLYNELV